MPTKKSFFDQFVALAACASLILGILGTFREDVSARAKSLNDVESLKQAAPGIEARLDAIERSQSALIKSQENLEKSIDRLQSSIDRLHK